MFGTVVITILDFTYNWYYKIVVNMAHTELVVSCQYSDFMNYDKYEYYKWSTTQLYIWNNYQLVNIIVWYDSYCNIRSYILLVLYNCTKYGSRWVNQYLSAIMSDDIYEYNIS